MEKTLNDNFKHTPVMLNECLDGLNIKSDGIYVDGTLGGGGHSGEILKRLTTGTLYAFDKDDDALSSTTKKLEKYSGKVVFIKSDFKNMCESLETFNIKSVDGILLDLGVSSYQIDTPERGFSYRFDGNLDMRMDKDSSLDASIVVNTYPREKLIKILYEYGEESFAKQIVNKIIEVWQEKKIETTGELVDIVESVIPKKFSIKGNVCKKTFQAIRIEVNKELEGLSEALHKMIDLLSSGGRLAVITFHSLEDRIVKNVFKERSTNCICDKSIPICTCNHRADVVLVNRKPIIATAEELALNKRSASAKLRVIEKL